MQQHSATSGTGNPKHILQRIFGPGRTVCGIHNNLLTVLTARHIINFLTFVFLLPPLTSLRFSIALWLVSQDSRSDAQGQGLHQASGKGMWSMRLLLPSGMHTTMPCMGAARVSWQPSLDVCLLPCARSSMSWTRTAQRPPRQQHHVHAPYAPRRGHGAGHAHHLHAPGHARH